MADKKLFKSENILATAGGQQGVLEELNLPPWLIDFLRRNLKLLAALAVALVVAVVAWNGYGRYNLRQENAAAYLLARAMQATDHEQRQGLLAELLAEYGSSGAAVWARLEQAHLAFEAAKPGEAASGYQQVLGELDAKNPLVPLVRLSLAQALVDAKRYDQARGEFEILASVKGFSWQGSLGLARTYRLMGKNDQARQTYQKLLAEKQLPSRYRDQAEAGLAAL